MPSPEQEGPAPDSPQSQEFEPAPYYQASRYPSERPAKRAYFQAQRAIFGASSHVDLSAYRFLLSQISHVVVIGEQPPEDLERRLSRILATGESTALPAQVLTVLQERRRAAQEVGPWVEGRYRPGRPVYPPDDHS